MSAHWTGCIMQGHAPHRRRIPTSNWRCRHHETRAVKLTDTVESAPFSRASCVIFQRCNWMNNGARATVDYADRVDGYVRFTLFFFGSILPLFTCQLFLVNVQIVGIVLAPEKNIFVRSARVELGFDLPSIDFSRWRQQNRWLVTERLIFIDQDKPIRRAVFLLPWLKVNVAGLGDNANESACLPNMVLGGALPYFTGFYRVLPSALTRCGRGSGGGRRRWPSVWWPFRALRAGYWRRNLDEGKKII